VELNRPVTSLSEITSTITVVATDPPTAAHLIADLEIPAARQVTTWYHVVDAPLTDGHGVLSVDGANRGPVLNTVALSNAAPNYAPPGRTLVSTSTFDTQADDAAIRAHLEIIYRTSTTSWSVIGRYAIPYALPAMDIPFQARKPVDLGDGLFVAGDHRDTASIQGAMVSGRRTADAILDRLGVPHD
jgi:predicted NAD/FAD-dependent oxidoreductase